MATYKSVQDRRKQRLRRRIRKLANGRPRLSVFRSSNNIYAQVIDDAAGNTLVSASTLEKDLRTQLKADGRSGGNVEAATTVGTLLAERAKEKGIDKVVFDRGGYLYHGRVKALAEAARAGGLDF